MLAIPTSAFDTRWSSSHSVDGGHTVVVNTDGRVADEFGNLRQVGCVLELCPFDVEDGPCVLALHVFVPKWKGEDAPAEIHLVGYGRSFDQQWSKKLLTYRIQLSSTSMATLRTQLASKSKRGKQRVAENLLPDWADWRSKAEEQQMPESVCGDWKLSVLEQTCAPASTVPWNPSCIANSGHIITVHDKAYCFRLFDQGPQPRSAVELGIETNAGMEPTLCSVEPWSGSVVIGTPGLVRIMRFD